MNLIIRADDLGFSEGINYGIEKSVCGGLVRSVGIMTNMPAAKHGIQLLKGIQGIAYGQHTNICVGRPLSDPAKIPSLVQENGEFKSSREYRTAYMEGRDFVCLDEVILEIEAQYQAFVDLVGHNPSYFECHAVASNNFSQGLEIVAQRHSLSYCPLKFDECIPFKNSILYNHLGSMEPDYDPYATIRTIIDHPHSRERECDVLICHPGYLDAYILKHSSLTTVRAIETEMLCSQEIRDYIADRNVRLLSYDEV